MSEVTEFVDDVYDVTAKRYDDGRRYRVFLVDDRTPTLFDAGHGADPAAVVEGVESTGVTPERLVVTHGDHDHVGALNEVTDAFDVEVWASEQTDLDREPDRRFDDGDEVGPFEAVHIPGHKPDSYAFVDENRSLAVFGDVMNGADQRGLPAGYLVLPPVVYSTDLNQLEKGLARLLDYEFETALVFHGSSVLEGASDRVEAFVKFPGNPDFE